MLFRHTMLYLPAQLLPALCQFAQLIVWSHLATPEVIGVVTLFVSIQEFLNIAFIGFWNQYTQRFVMKLSETEEDRLRLRYTSTFVIALSLCVQIVIAIVIYAVAIDRQMSLGMGLVLAGLIGGRALNLFQGERARARHDVFGYSIAVMSGPVLGLALGLGFLWCFGSSAFVIFLGFVIAQLAGVVFGIARDSSWIGIGKPDSKLMRHAIGYGGPLLLSGVLAWVTQNASRIAVSYVYGLGAVGIYSLGFGLGYRAAIVSAMIVTAAAFPIAVRLANAGDLDGARRQIAANGALLFGILAASVVGLAMISSDVLHLLVSRKVTGPVGPIMLWSLLAGAFICFRQHFLNQFFLLQGKTRPIATVAVIEAVVAIALAAVVIPFAGPVGGAIALAATSATSMLVTFVLARSVGLIMPWVAIGRISLAALAMALAVMAVPVEHDMWGLVLRIAAGGATYLLVLALCYAREVGKWFKSKRRPVGQLERQT